MTKHQVWNQMNIAWRRAFRKTVRVWMAHVKASDASVRNKNKQCSLCAQGDYPKGVRRCTQCPIRLERLGRPDSADLLPCTEIRAFGDWSKAKALGRPAHRHAKDVLRYLLGFLPKGEKLKMKAKELLGPKVEEK